MKHLQDNSLLATVDTGPLLSTVCLDHLQMSEILQQGWSSLSPLSKRSVRLYCVAGSYPSICCPNLTNRGPQNASSIFLCSEREFLLSPYRRVLTKPSVLPYFTEHLRVCLPAKRMTGLTVKRMRNKVGQCLFKSLGLPSKQFVPYGRNLDVFPSTQDLKLKTLYELRRAKNCQSKDYTVIWIFAESSY